MAVIYRIYQMFASFAMVYCICEFGHRVSNAFEETNNAIVRLKWYLFPIGTMQLLPIVIAGAHQPVVFIVFGSLTCSRADFQMV